MDILESLDNIRFDLEDSLDSLVGKRKAVCPHCKKVVRLIGDTNVLSSHVFIPDEDNLDFSNGVDFSVIVDCPASGSAVKIITLDW